MAIALLLLMLQGHAASTLFFAAGMLTAAALSAGWRMAGRRRNEELARAGRGWFEEALSRTGDAMAALDPQGRVSFLNPAAEELTGWKQLQAVGRPWRDAFRIIDEDTREPSDAGLARVVAEGISLHLPGRNLLVRPDGAERAIEAGGSPIRDAEGGLTGAAILFRDVTEERRRARHLAVHHAVARALTDSSGGGDADSLLLQSILENLGWECAALWAMDPASGVLRCRKALHRSQGSAEFVEQSLRTSFPPGIGLPGRVWSAGSPTWIADVQVDDNFPRGPWAAQAGLHGAVGFPVKRGDEVLAILEFFSRTTQSPDEALLETLATLGVQVGQFLHLRRTEESLRASEARSRAVMEAAIDAVILMDHQGKVMEFNPAAEKTFGHRREEAVGREMADLIIPPSLRERHRLGLASYLAGGEGPAIGRRLEMTGRRADGGEFPVELAITVVAGEERPLFAGFVRDITERKQWEEKHARLSALVESSYDAIIGKSMEGIIFSWNAGAERIYGYRAEEVVGKSISILIPPGHRNQLPEIMEQLRRGGRIDHFETVRVKKDGRQIDISLTVSPIRDGAGRVVGGSSIARDITEKKRAETEIRRLNEELERRVEERTAKLAAVNQELEAFCYSVSHDLRAPLRAIDGFSRILVDEYGRGQGEEFHRVAGIVRSSAQNMGRLIDDLLAFSRIGRRDLDDVDLDLEALARSAFQDSLGGEKDRAIRLEVGRLPPARGDRTMLGQVLANLIGNAVKFTRTRPEAVIEVKGKVEGGENVYWVKDNGVGFDMRYAEKLFGVFQRLHDAGEFEGTGVGLAIVQRVVERHGGRVWAESEVDGGATFFFTLPRRKESGERRADRHPVGRGQPL